MRRAGTGDFSRRAVLAAAALAPFSAGAEPLSLRRVVQAVSAAERADLRGQDLSRLDLSGLDFRGADLAGGTLFGADLTDARLSGCALAGAVLDRAVIIRTDFSGADLRGASLFLPAASSRYDENPAHEAPRFARADLSGARLLGHFANGDWRGADLSRARLELGRIQFLARMRSDLGGCDLTGATLRDAALAGVRLAFANLRGADLRGADLTGADLGGAKLDGARLAGAVLRGTELRGASLRGAAGLDATVDLDGARNLDRASR